MSIVFVVWGVLLGFGAWGILFGVGKQSHCATGPG